MVDDIVRVVNKALSCSKVRLIAGILELGSQTLHILRRVPIYAPCIPLEDVAMDRQRAERILKKDITFSRNNASPKGEFRGIGQYPKP